MLETLDFTEDEIAITASEGQEQQLHRVLRFVDYLDGEEVAMHLIDDEPAVRRAVSADEMFAITRSHDAVLHANAIATPPGLRSAPPDGKHWHAETGPLRAFQIGCASSDNPTRAFSCAKSLLHRLARLLKSRRALGLCRHADGGSVIVAINHVSDSDQLQTLLCEIGESVANCFAADWGCSISRVSLVPVDGMTCDDNVARLDSGDIYRLHGALAARYQPMLLSFDEAIEYAEQFVAPNDKRLMKYLRPFLADLKRVRTRNKKAGDDRRLDSCRATEFNELIGERLRDEDHGRDMFDFAATLPQEGDE